ncbi:MAG TPA: hypothetical protein DCS93_10950 [Microscillaceae bacterium]|nr:hypothetical protein [Microscillaceae bacterium]
MKHLLKISLLVFILPNLSQAQRHQTTTDSLRQELQRQRMINKKLIKAKILLEYKLENGRTPQDDSLQKLLDNVRQEVRIYRQEALRLKNLLESAYRMTDSLQRAYDALPKQKPASPSTSKKLNGSNALFAMTMRAIPGEILRNRFSPSTRARRTDRVQVVFKLTRAPLPGEKLTIRLFDDSNTEILLFPDYHNKLGKPTPINQNLIIKPDINYFRRFARGNYSIRLFLTNTNQGIHNQAIGITEFSLR